jgi:hypothetical protein
MQTEAVNDQVRYLNGLSLAEAFRKFVIEDSEVAAVGRRLSEASRGNSAVFSDGQFPGPFVDFHWPLHSTPESIAWAFVYSPIMFMDEPLPSASDLEKAVSKLLSDRIAVLKDYLARGKIIAIGTFAATGVEGPIGHGQWMRKNLSIDISNSDVCELRDHRSVAIWTGVSLQSPDESRLQAEVAIAQASGNEPTKSRKQIQTKENCRRECLDWLKTIMSDPKVRPLTNEELWKEAVSKWPEKLSKRDFDRCRAAALSGLSDEQRYLWGRPGPKRKRS